MVGVDVDELTDGLYALPLEEFTAARTALQKRVRAELGGPAAATVQGIRKPNLAAWLINQVARSEPAELAALVELGIEVRRAGAGASGEQLRGFAARERELSRALCRQVAEVGRAAGRTAGAEVLRGAQETFHAVVVDDSVAELVAAGRLTTPLQRVGFVSAAPGLRLVPSPRDDEDPPTPEERARLEREARRLHQAAVRASEQADADLEAAERVARKADATLEKRRRQVDEAIAKRHRAERAQAEAASALEAARGAAAQAQEDLAETTAHLPPS